jgi:beta-apo-4'-carotenal oxygenase
VGTSGTGAYRGKSSFDCFSHRRSITSTPSWIEGLIGVRYPPYRGKLARFRAMQELKPGFDRLGRAQSGWLVWLLRLGAAGTGGGVLRYLVLVLGEFFPLGDCAANVAQR